MTNKYVNTKYIDKGALRSKFARSVHMALRPRGEFRPRQTRQLPRAVDLKGRLLKLLITTTPFHSLTERYSMNVDGNFK